MAAFPEKLKAIVLSSLDYGDTDRIVSLFTLEHGRISAFARSARKSRKRFGAALETFSRIEAQARVKEGLCSLQDAVAETTFIGIRSDLARIGHALYACELVEAMTPEGHPLPRLYRLLATYLEYLDTKAAVESDRRFFEINLLNILGYRPALEECSRCEARFNASGAVLSDHGHMVCPGCGNGKKIDLQTIRTLSGCMTTGKFGMVLFNAATLLQAGELLDDAVAEHAGRKLRSLEFLRQVV